MYIVCFVLFVIVVLSVISAVSNYPALRPQVC